MGNLDPAGGQNPQQPPPRVIPFGKYLLLDRIAVGGMAEVYTAKSFGIEGFEKIIAIKRILPTMAEDRDFIAMFIDEAKIAGHLTHANIVPIYELGKIGEAHYIAMEYVWGKDLLQIMNRFRRMRRHMPPVMAAWISSKMLEGLDYAHRKRDRHGRPMGIIHRDVSPQNCLISYEGQIKLIDFGIAKAASRNTKTQAGVLKGKFGYMSPEQVRGNPVDHRSDIFAASTCLHEMLTGERLFVGESDFSTLEKVRNAEVVPPSQSIAEMPPELEEILLKGLAREPDERWQTAGEMQEALQRFIALQRPPFGTSKLNTWMRTAFAPEIAKEKSRLDTFSKVGHPGMGQPPAPPAPPARNPALSTTSPQLPTKRNGPAPMRDADPFGDEPASFDGDVADEVGGDEEIQGEATMISSSPFDALMDAQAAAGPRMNAVIGAPSAPMEELAEQPTQIFFTADEIQEVQSVNGPLSPAPAGSLSVPAPAPKPPATGPVVVAARVQSVGVPSAPAGMPPPQRPLAQTMQLQNSPVPPPNPMGQPMPHPPIGQPAQTPAPFQSSPGGFPQPQQPYGQQPQARPQQPIFPQPPGAPGQPQRHLETLEVDRPGQMRPVPEKKNNTLKLAVAALALALLFLVGIAVVTVVMFGGDSTGTISIRVTPQTADARVFVDGLQAGHAPLMLENVREGTHQIQVRADGYRIYEQEVEVQGDGTATLQIALEAETAVAAVVPPVPVVQPPQPAQPIPPPPQPIAEAQPPQPPAQPIAQVPPPQQQAAADPPARPVREPAPEPQQPRVPQRVAQADPPQRPAREQPREQEEPAGDAARGSGFLLIQTIPWARVFLDGRDTGRNTPVRQLRVPAGQHTVGLRTNDGTMHNVPVTVVAGQTHRIVRQLQ
jgi:serine/threonine protein kinase